MDLLLYILTCGPIEHLCVFFIFGWFMVYVMSLIFRNNPFYYIIFLMSITFFSCFSKELFIDLPMYLDDALNVIFNMVGVMCGIITAELFKRHRRKKTFLR